jgi:hypothetical protein
VISTSGCAVGGVRAFCGAASGTVSAADAAMASGIASVLDGIRSKVMLREEDSVAGEAVSRSGGGVGVSQILIVSMAPAAPMASIMPVGSG